MDLTKVEGFDWDAGNSRKSADKHAVSQAEAEQVFFDDSVLVLIDDRHSVCEVRLHALGCTADGRRLHISFALRRDGRLIRVISARDMSWRERLRYGREA